MRRNLLVCKLIYVGNTLVFVVAVVSSMGIKDFQSRCIVRGKVKLEGNKWPPDSDAEMCYADVLVVQFQCYATLTRVTTHFALFRSFSETYANFFSLYVCMMIFLTKNSSKI